MLKFEFCQMNFIFHILVAIFSTIPDSTETHLEPSQTSKMERFAKIFNNLKPLTIFEKHSILDV